MAGTGRASAFKARIIAGIVPGLRNGEIQAEAAGRSYVPIRKLKNLAVECIFAKVLTVLQRLGPVDKPDPAPQAAE
jgi:hypothetical protein